MIICDHQELIFGAPGCGKTTTLLSVVENKIDAGVDSSRIAYVSFTRKAVGEAIERAQARFKLTKKDFPYFKTIHAFCFKQLGLLRSDVLSADDYEEFSKKTGFRFSYGAEQLDDCAYTGDQMLSLYSLARASRLDMQVAWARWGDRLFEWHAFKHFCSTYTHFKEQKAAFDFTDMLEQYVADPIPARVDVAIIDEAQDLSLLQWDVLQAAFRGVGECYVAGDDDQAIYQWSGADAASFLSLAGKKSVLNKSYRLPSTIHAFSQRLISRVKTRVEKRFAPADRKGAVTFCGRLDSFPLHEVEGDWLVLVRNVFLLPRVYDHMRALGMSYYMRNGKSSVDARTAGAIVGWERMRKGQAQSSETVATILRLMTRKKFDLVPDSEYTLDELPIKFRGPWYEAFALLPIPEREYYLSILRRHGTKGFLAAPRVRVSTIHATKGGEADNVLLLPDMSARTYQGYRDDPDPEHRVFYVGATRARHRLHICTPEGEFAYPFVTH